MEQPTLQPPEPRWPPTPVRMVITGFAIALALIVLAGLASDRLRYSQQVASRDRKIEVLEAVPLNTTSARLTFLLDAPPGATASLWLEGRQLDLVGGEVTTTHVHLKGLLTYIKIKRDGGGGLGPDEDTSKLVIWAWREVLTATPTRVPLLLVGLLALLALLTAATQRAGGSLWHFLLQLSPIGCPALALQKRYREAWLASWIQLLLPALFFYSLSRLATGLLPDDFWLKVWHVAVPCLVLLPGWLVQLVWAVATPGHPAVADPADEGVLWGGSVVQFITPLSGIGQFIQRRYKAAWGFLTLTMLSMALFFSPPANTPEWGPSSLQDTPRWVGIAPPLNWFGALGILFRTALFLLLLILLLLAVWGLVDALISMTKSPSRPQPLPPAQPLPPTEGEI